MKQKSIFCLLILSLLPMCAFAGSIEGYELMYSKLSEMQLYDQRLNNTEEIVISSFAATGGIVLTGLGVAAGFIGYSMFTAEPVVELDDLGLLMWPITLSVLFIQYVGGIALVGTGGLLCYGGTGIALSAAGNITFQVKKNRSIQLELKKFKPITQEFRSGIGIGVSLTL